VDNNDIVSRYLNIEMNATQIKTESDAGEKAGWLEIVRRQVGSLRFGVVQIVVHDSQVTQIEKTERVRLDKSRGQTV
jgi:hypothetical protein